MTRWSAPAAALAALVALIGAGLAAGTSEEEGLPPWPKIALVRDLGPFDNPTHVAHAGDGSGRLFVVEQKGRIRIAKDGAVRPAPFLDISGRVSCCGAHGLRSVAFPWDFPDKRYFYVDYTDKAGDTVIARFRVSADPDAADPNSEQILLTVKQAEADGGGGPMAFGLDGHLYVGTRGGGSASGSRDPAQDPGSLRGKILRIDTESRTQPYGIPPDNPFVKKEGYRPEIWALGLHNPQGLSIDPKTGDLYVADAGHERWEEINVQPGRSLGGENYGWDILEGSHCRGPETCKKEGIVLPASEYDRSQGCAVAGGMVHRGKALPDLEGIYLYGDRCSGRIWGLRREGDAWKGKLLADTPLAISTIAEDEKGDLYVGDRKKGYLHKIEIQR